MTMSAVQNVKKIKTLKKKPKGTRAYCERLALLPIKKGLRKQCVKDRIGISTSSMMIHQEKSNENVFIAIQFYLAHYDNASVSK